MKQRTRSWLDNAPPRRVLGPLVFAWLAMLSAMAVTPAESATVYIAHLDGDQEVPAVTTDGFGVAKFRIDATLTTLWYELNVFDISNVITAAHIHLAPVNTNGPAVVNLSWLVEGTITASDFLGSFAGSEMTDLLAHMSAGNAYVNVHTQAYPAGEIRGQISPVPLPAALPMFLAGLAGLGYVGWRKSKRTAQAQT